MNVFSLNLFLISKIKLLILPLSDLSSRQALVAAVGMKYAHSKTEVTNHRGVLSKSIEKISREFISGIFLGFFVFRMK